MEWLLRRVKYTWSYSPADLNAIARPGRIQMLPPSEYDHPFEGRLLIIDGGDPGMMRLMCERTKAPPEMYFLGCASLSPAIRKLYGDADCVIIHASEELHARYQWTVNLTVRHEIAHCNGWPGDHPGRW
jgi:hypothetical protein